MRIALPPPPTPPRHASHGGRGDEWPVHPSSKLGSCHTIEKMSNALCGGHDCQTAPRVSPPHASEASGGGGGPPPPKAIGGGGPPPPRRRRGGGGGGGAVGGEPP